MTLAGNQRTLWLALAGLACATALAVVCGPLAGPAARGERRPASESGQPESRSQPTGPLLDGRTEAPGTSPPTPPARTVVVSVFDATTGAPLSGRTVCLEFDFPSSASSSWDVLTDDRGVARLAGLPSGPGSLRVRLGEGQMPFEFEGESAHQDSRVLPVHEEDREFAITLSARSGRHVEGAVVHADGAPVAMADVEAFVDDDAYAYAKIRARSDGAGRFALWGLPDRSVIVRARPPEGDASGAGLAVVAAGAGSTALVLPPAPNGSDRQLTLRARGPGGERVAGFRWRLVSPGGERWWTDRRGSTLVEGELTVSKVDLPAWVELWLPRDGRDQPLPFGPVCAAVEAGDASVELAFPPERSQEVEVQDEAGRPLAGATVVAEPLWSSAYWPRPATELARVEQPVAGRADLRPLPVGPVRLFVVVPAGYATPLPRVVRPGDEEAVVFVAHRAPDVRLRVTDADGDPVFARVDVRDLRLPYPYMDSWVHDARIVAHGETENGGLVLRGLDPEVRYRLDIQGGMSIGVRDGAARMKRCAAYQVDPWRPHSMDVVLPLLGSLTGCVQGDPELQGAVFDILRWSPSGYVRVGRSRPDGSFAIEGLEVGPVLLRAWPAGHAPPKERRDETAAVVPGVDVTLGIER